MENYKQITAMATFSIVIRGKRNDGYYPVYICVNHKSKPAYIKTSFVVSGKGLKKTYTKTGKERTEVSDKLITRECMNEIAGYVRRLNDIDSREMSVQEIVEYLTYECAEELSFTKFANDHISKMFSSDRTNSALSYRMAVKRLHEYMNKSNILFSDITVNVIRGWIDGMMDSFRKRSLYPVCIKAIFNAAMLKYNDEDREISRIKRNPFAKITIPKARQSEKRSIRIETIRTFFNAEIPGLFMREEMARDVCRMIFCLAGINTADLYDLPADALKDGILHYRRKKTRDKSLTGSYTEIKIPEIILPLFEKYKGEKRLLCFSERYATAMDFASVTGKACKRICEKACIEEKITPYSFRHSWATIALNECGASMDDVAFALNHVSAHRVTSIYIKPDYSRIDKLNSLVLDKVFML
ncbi:MAG: site-specific integrase [Tannerellaceae bacterium]|jgi:site-specific recombinase XerD|nr:site-specific integrase [Tannerellaceae bacterium]